MLFKIILFLSYGCFAKTKRNLKWEAGVGGRKKRLWPVMLAACVWNVPLQPKKELANNKHLQFIDYYLKILLNLSKKMSLFLLILKAFHYYHRKLCTSITIPLLHSMRQCQRPWMYDSSQGWVSRGLQYGQSFSPSTLHSIIKKGNWLMFGFGTSHS